jgi:hypothetical protein
MLIAGVSTASADSWIFASPEWLSSVLPEGYKNARVLTFEYEISLSEADFTCQDFLLQGDALLGALSEARAQSQYRPLFCVWHSVGGLVLKQALCIANEQLYQYESVLSPVTGVIFLGTPHSGSTDGEILPRLLTLLARTSNMKKRISISDQSVARETAMLSQLASRFEGISLRSSILTVWESQRTRVSEDLLKSKMAQVSTFID